jgi:hypothetical protein
VATAREIRGIIRGFIRPNAKTAAISIALKGQYLRNWPEKSTFYQDGQAIIFGRGS